MLPLLLSLVACTKDEVLDPAITQAADPAEPSAPVGVMAFSGPGVTGHVWYPTQDGATGEAAEIDLLDFVPESFQAAISGIDVPRVATSALVDAPMRRTGTPWPVVVFSHGFGGFSAQSTDLTAHLASRGYVVIAPEHPSRAIGSLAPCLLASTMDECQLDMSFDPEARDPAVDDVSAALAWVDAQVADAWAGVVDADVVGIFGHSAGGGTTTGATNELGRFQASLAMAGSGTFTATTPSAVIGGSCDGVVPEAGEGGLASSGASATEGYWSLAGGGHMAFADLCGLDLGAVGEQIKALEGANAFFVDSMLGLATDGCPGFAPAPELACGETYLDLGISGPILRESVTRFFDQHLLGASEGLTAVQAPELTPL